MLNLIFVLQNSTPRGVSEPLPGTLSQMRVSREAILTNKSLQMLIRANSLLNSCNSRSRDEDISMDSDLPQVLICVNSLAESFNSRFSELPFLSIFFFFHRHYTCRRGMSICQTVTTLSAIFEAARGLFSGLFEHAFFISKHHRHRVSIGCLDPSQYQFVTTVYWISPFLIFAGRDLQHCGLNFH